MQVERQHGGTTKVLREKEFSGAVGGEWRTGEEYIGIYLVVGDNVGKLTLIPHTNHG